MRTAKIAVATIMLTVLVIRRVTSNANRRVIRARTMQRQPCRARSHSGLVASVDRLALRWRHHRNREGSQAAQLAVVLDDTARRCASGHSLAAALLAAIVAHESDHTMQATIETFAPLALAMRAGCGLDESLDRIQIDDPDVALAVLVLRLCCTQGGSITESLDRSATTLRERQVVRDERIANAGQARLSARVLTVVPMVFAGWTVVTTESVQRFVTSPLGLGCVTLGLGLNVTGWALMRRAIEGGR